MTSRTALPTSPLIAPERALPAKTRLDEFEIELVLSQGSFGIVYRAYDHALKLHVAIKEYLPDALALRSAETQVVLRARTHAERFEQGLQAFVNEAQTLARADHPALLRISRLLLRHGTAYRVMRYSPGPTLLAHRRELGAMPPAASMRAWLDALLGALETLHEEGCVHAAVAPGNILLLADDRPMLLDFDAVRAALISDRTQSMMAALEPCFEPIEQRAPGPYSVMGPWTDLYALAATLHFCISGQLPAPPSGADPVSRFEPLDQVWQRLQLAQPELGAPPPWLSALDACLHEDPQARPQSVAQLRALLGDVPEEVAKVAPARAPAAPTMPTKSPVPDIGHDTLSLPGAAAPAAAAAATTASAAPPVVPPAPTPADPEHAKVIADLDMTFAFIAAQASEDANAKPAAAVDPMPAGAAQAGGAAAAEPTADPAPGAALAGGPVAASPPSREQLMLAGGAVLLMLALVAAVAVWLYQDSPAAPMSAATPPAMSSPLSRPTAGASDDATTKALEAAAAALAKSPPQAGPPPAAPPAKVASPPKDEPPAPSPPKAKVAVVTSPRAACGNRAHFALYQCMQTQCAKRQWSKHPQCVQFRKEQKL